MKIFILLIALFSFSTANSQVTRLTGVLTDDTVAVFSKQSDQFMKLSYQASGSYIEEYKNDKLVDKLTVNSVEFFEEKIFYNVTNDSGFTFGFTYTFEDRSVFLGDIHGNFTQLYGKGLSFSHRY